MAKTTLMMKPGPMNSQKKGSKMMMKRGAGNDTMAAESTGVAKKPITTQPQPQSTFSKMMLEYRLRNGIPKSPY